MAYIIENANIFKNHQLINCSILVKDNQIVGLQSKYTYYNFIRMNADPYIMTPTYCILDTKIPIKSTFQELREYMTTHYLLNGCTTLLTFVNISYEHELEEKVKEIKTALINSPIDFIIGIKIPLHLISQSFIRKCKKEKISAIFVEIMDPDKLEDIPWGWIKDTLFPYNCPMIPVISSSVKKEHKTVLAKWKHVMEKEKIPAINEELKENIPLSVSVLNKIGIYPRKASLMHGTELSYNLYLKERELLNVDEVSLFHYHIDRLVVTVHRGKVLRAGTEVLFKPGNGEYVKVRTPSYFSL
jgi:hypothetical protein